MLLQLAMTARTSFLTTDFLTVLLVIFRIFVETCTWVRYSPHRVGHGSIFIGPVYGDVSGVVIVTRRHFEGILNSNKD